MSEKKVQEKKGVKINNYKDEIKSIKSIRRLIVIIISVIVISIGLPLFKSTTSIYRAELPVEEIRQKTSTFVNDDLHFQIPVYLDIPNSLEYFIPRAQEVIDESLYKKYPNLRNIWSIELKRQNYEYKVDPENDYIVKFEYLKNPTDEEDSLPVESFYISPFSKTSLLYLTDAVIKSKQVDDFLRVVLLENVFVEEINEISKLIHNETNEISKNLVLPYSSNYNIVISLLVENGKTISWEIEESIKLLTPILNILSHFTNFTISSQIQYYSKLTNPPKFDESLKANIIPESDLSTFINYGDWNLITHDIHPSINFLVYFPTSNYENKPLIVENSNTNSFLIPQWGGVYIFNKDLPILQDNKVNINENELLPVMEIFTSQLFELLGIPNKPKSPIIRIDSLSRISTLKNLKKSLNNLESLVKLTESLNEISIPELTKTYVLTTINFFNKSIKSINEKKFKLAMIFSSESLFNSDKAFFEKEMVQQAYFPSEHKLAVFLPLLGPVSSIILIGLIKTLKDYKNDKKDENESKTEEDENENESNTEEDEGNVN